MKSVLKTDASKEVNIVTAPWITKTMFAEVSQSSTLQGITVFVNPDIPWGDKANLNRLERLVDGFMGIRTPTETELAYTFN